MQTVKCIACHSDVIIDDEAVDGDLIECANCGAQLEVFLHPLRANLIAEGEMEIEEE